MTRGRVRRYTDKRCREAELRSNATGEQTVAETKKHTIAFLVRINWYPATQICKEVNGWFTDWTQHFQSNRLEQVRRFEVSIFILEVFLVAAN